jgi:hypothetical protein
MAQINIKKNASASVSTPPSGVQAIFIGTDGILYGKSDAGAVTQLAGLTGPAGSAGSSGTSGVSGSSGTSGVGSSGSSGTSGVNGDTGSSGSSGTSGVGSSGSSGTSGVGSSGSSGTSGTSPAGGGASPIELLNANQLVSASIGATANGTFSDFSIAIGYNANAKNGYNDVDRGGIAIGKNSKSNGRETLAIGEGANCAPGGGSVAIGNNAGQNDGAGDSCTLVGTSTFATSGYSVGVGRESRARGNWTIAMGSIVNCYGHASIVIGGQAGMATDVFSEGCILMGYGAFAAAQYSIGLGHQVKIMADNAVAIGYGSTASHTGAVVLGADNKSVVANHTHIKSLFLSNVLSYADNAAALTAGLTAGQVYRTSTGTLMITY